LTPAEQPRRLRPDQLGLGLAALVLLLGAVAVLSLMLGARPVAPDTVWAALVDFDPTLLDHTVIVDLRLPRTLIGLLVGAGLGLAGALLQGATRNPLADPSILGINAGAAAAVVMGLFLFGIARLDQQVWLAFGGAAAAMVLVYSVAAIGREGATPIKLALAGAATTAALNAVISAMLLTSPSTLDQIRFWQVGALAGRDLQVLVEVAPFLIAGIGAALLSARALDGLSMGEDVARGLGQNVERSRFVIGLVAVLLAGAGVAAAGPIAFVGLTIPHVARAIAGSSYRWVLPYSMVLAPILLLGADIVGRMVAAPGELQVGIVTAAIGAPFFIVLVRRRRLAEL
jgi:iron complex transport system permease protein